MKLSPVASTFSRELLKDSGANGLNAFLGRCAGEGVGPAVAGLFASGGAAALGVLGSATLLIGPILWEHHTDTKRKQELADRLTEMCAVLDRAATDADEANRQLTEIAERRQFVWARISGADQADFARRVTDNMQDMVRAMLKELGKNDRALLVHIEKLKDIAYDSNFRLIGIKADTEALLDGQGQILEGQDRLESLLQPIIDDYIRRIRDEQSNNEALAQQLQSVTSERDDLRDQLEAALLEQAQTQLDTGKSIEQVLADLRAGSPRDLLAFLDEQVADDDAQFEQDRLRLIARHRERAAIAYPLGEINKAEASLNRILQLAPGDLEALNELGHIRNLQGDLDEAQRLYTRVLDAAPDKAWQAASLGNLGLIEQIRGNLDAAEDYFTRSLALDEQLGRKEGIAAALGDLGLIERTRGNLDAAEDYHTRALALDEQLGRKEGMAADLGNLGGIELTRGNLDAAEDYLARSLALHEQLGRKKGMAINLGNLGLIEKIRGNLDAAQDYHTRSLALNEQLGRKEGMADQLGNLGLIERRRGNLDAAQDYHTRALALNEQLGRKEGMAADLGNLGLIERRRGNLDAAQDFLARSLALHEQLGRKEGMAVNLGNLGAIEHTRGNLDAAQDYLNRALALHEHLGSKEGMADQLAALGLIEHDRGNLPEACTLWRRALDLYEQVGAQPQIEQVRSVIAKYCPDQPGG